MKIITLALLLIPLLDAVWNSFAVIDGPEGSLVSVAKDLSGRGNHASPTNSPTWKA